MNYKPNREYLFAFPIDSEHTFCYRIENKREQAFIRQKKGRKGEQTDEYEKQEYTQSSTQKLAQKGTQKIQDQVKFQVHHIFSDRDGNRNWSIWIHHRIQ